MSNQHTYDVPFTAEQLAEDYSGPTTVKETVGFALDWIETKKVTT